MTTITNIYKYSASKTAEFQDSEFQRAITRMGFRAMIAMDVKNPKNRTRLLVLLSSAGGTFSIAVDAADEQLAFKEVLVLAAQSRPLGLTQ